MWYFLIDKVKFTVKFFLYNISLYNYELVFDITRIDNIVNNNLFRFCTKELFSFLILC